MNLEARLSQIEARLAALELASRTPSNPSEGAFWALDYLRQTARPGGEVVFAGHAEVASGTWGWQWGLPVGSLLSVPWAEVAPSLAALAHPLRLEILRAVLNGKSSSQDLQHLVEVGTTGQLYHHLKELQSGGWLKAGKRGSYTVPPERVIPLLVILSAAGGEALAAQVKE
ncbi:helix-turn-helix domain-containing protein [Meiothermus sp. CFH 77666]|uniref:helix-turn-helix domain-containing protein n=1 Tax=Meiothermus sp. CFH 77666 TaxID=2817942 RepID=UPI001AA0A4BD|nr:winged helix-turn-helix transcriptional regulator [Meiothermus sp. CFH 77666]